MLRNAMGGGPQLSRKKHYEGVRFKVISVTAGGWGANSLEKKRYVTLEWPPTCKQEQLDKENSWCKGSGENENERPKRINWN